MMDLERKIKASKIISLAEVKTVGYGVLMGAGLDLFLPLKSDSSPASMIVYGLGGGGIYYVLALQNSSDKEKLIRQSCGLGAGIAIGKIAVQLAKQYF